VREHLTLDPVLLVAIAPVRERRGECLRAGLRRHLNGAVSESALYEFFSGYCGTISAAKSVFTVGGLRTIAAMGSCSFHPASLAQLVFTCCLFVTYFDINSLGDKGKSSDRPARRCSVLDGI
jgi:hypothetical protein